MTLTREGCVGPPLVLVYYSVLRMHVYSWRVALLLVLPLGLSARSLTLIVPFPCGLLLTLTVLDRLLLLPAQCLRARHAAAATGTVCKVTNK